MSENDKITWHKTAAAAWALHTAHRGYTASIALVGSIYTLTIVGPGAPGPSTYSTLRTAKNGFRHFLANIGVS